MSAKVLGGLCLYGVIMTGATAILAYLLTSCGIESNIEGNDNEVVTQDPKGCVQYGFLIFRGRFVWKQRKEKIKLEKIEKMKSELRKQGLIVDNAKTVEVDAIDQNPIEPRIKYYGMDTLPAV